MEAQVIRLENSAKSFAQNREFLFAIVATQIRLRYAQSFLGLLWMIIQPLLLVGTLSAVFVILGRKGIKEAPYPIYFYSALLPFNLFKSALVDGTSTFVSETSLLTKIAFRREIIIFKNCCLYFVDFLLANVAFVVIMAVYRYPPNQYWIYLPLILSLVLMLSLGVMFLFASLNVFIRDIAQFLHALGSILFWFTPVVFNYENVGKGRILYWLNPMAGVVKCFREIIVSKQPPSLEYLRTILIAAPLFLIVGYFTFRKLERGFVDVI